MVTLLAREPAIARLSDDPLFETLQYIWTNICQEYDVIAELPGSTTLFEGAQLTRPYDAAETVIVNMLLEIIEKVDRFSPWYTKPAKVFGIAAEHNRPVRWRLTGQGCDRWWKYMDSLATVIEENENLIKAMMLVEQSMTGSSSDEPYVLAKCYCSPPLTIQVKRSLLNRLEIICDCCQQPFQPF